MDTPATQLDTLVQDKPLWGLGEVLHQAWPASMSMLSGTVMMFVDGWMVASTGEASLAAQFAGGLTSFVLTSFCLGMLTVVNTFVSQNLGANKLRRCGQYAWAGLAIAVGLAILTQLIQFVAPAMFGLFGHEAQVQQLECLYFRYMIGGVGLFLVGRVMEQFFYGVHRPMMVLIASIVGNVCNIAINYVLIYGKLGFPAMGLEGAAIGTVCGSALSVLLLAGVFFRKSFHEKYATRNWRDLKFRECRDILRIGWPAGLQFFNDILSWGLITVYLVGKFGTEHLTANAATVRYMMLSGMPAVGIGIATTALVGRYIGQGRPDLARKRAHAAALTAGVYMSLCGLLFLLYRHELVRFYINQDAASASARQIVTIGGKMMICAAIFQFFDAIGIVYVGALRGAGDTRFTMILTVILCWGVLACGGFLLTWLLPEWKSIGPWTACSVYIILLGVLMMLRFESGRWRNIDLLQKDTPAPPPNVLAEAPQETNFPPA